MNNSSAATRGEVTTMDDEKTLKQQIAERVLATYPESLRASTDASMSCPTLAQLAPLCETAETATRLLKLHASWIDGTRDEVQVLRDEVSALRREVAALRSPPPRWRTVAAGALDGLAAMLRGSW